MTPKDTEHVPPPLPPIVNSIELTCTEHSKITGVSVYSGRAEVTRLFKFGVMTGQNQVVINGLPHLLDQDSLRVEGRGAATIHDVTILHVPRISPPPSPALVDLDIQRHRVSKALERAKTSHTHLGLYLATMNVQHIDIVQAGKVVKEYDKIAEELDELIFTLENQLKDIDDARVAEQANMMQAPNKFDVRSKIGLFADKEGEVEIILIYAVTGASWTALYDIRVDMNTKEEPITLVYKAAIKQHTGEDWNDIPLTLETATPTFGVNLPTLDPWNITVYKPPPPRPFAMAPSAAPPGTAMRRSMNIQLTSIAGVDSHSEESAFGTMAHRELHVSSKGNVSATFEVPGLISIPSDNDAHNVTIVELRFNAAMSWVCVPKKDTRVHLSAKIKNTSQFTLLSGSGSIYVDGSFISRSKIPSVSPEESFDCHLGLDPSIRVTYHPQTKKQSQTGRYIKTSVTHNFVQHVTIFNAKSTLAERVRVIEQIPTSEDDKIQVDLVNPALPQRAARSHISAVAKPITVSKGVVALWDGADEPEQDVDMVGQSGKLNWVCMVPPQGKVNLTLQWEVTAPARTRIEGL